MSIPPDQWLPRFGSEFQICLQQMDIATNRGLLVWLDENAYRNASFLDQRALAHNPPGQWFGLDDIWRAANGTGAPHYIFHIGHCGSTLISRLLDSLGAFGLREPLPLRTMAEAAPMLDEAWSLFSPTSFEDGLARLNALWGRKPASGALPIVKATSSCSGLSAPLLALSPQSRALTLGLDLERYLATVLAGQYAPFEFRAAAALRLQRLARLGIEEVPNAHEMDTPDFAALAWITETLAARQLAQVQGDRVLHVDFDAFLQAPGEQLGAIARHFGLAATDQEIQSAISSPVMTRYSKAPEHGYSTDLRDQVVARSMAENSAAIRQGMAWANYLIARSTLLSEVLGTR
ncbi:hypothetical protein [Hyphobacterium sp.]|uniref:hypothetical protein n=1 Tax=Hyphobacterium sp. TaxID=2004662 RepID=UPI0037482B62